MRKELILGLFLTSVLLMSVVGISAQITGDVSSPLDCKEIKLIQGNSVFVDGASNKYALGINYMSSNGEVSFYLQNALTGEKENFIVAEGVTSELKLGEKIKVSDLSGNSPYSVNTEITFSFCKKMEKAEATTTSVAKTGTRTSSTGTKTSTSSAKKSSGSKTCPASMTDTTDVNGVPCCIPKSGRTTGRFLGFMFRD